MCTKECSLPISQVMSQLYDEKQNDNRITNNKIHNYSKQ